MKLAMFMMPIHPPARDYHATLREDLEAIIHADQLGFDAFWLGEHFTAAAEPITSPLLFFAQAIPQTQRIKFCTGVINLPQLHPAVVAGYAAMFDHMCEGRFVMGVSAGGLPSDFELFGLQDDAARPQMMLESLQMILHLWTHDPPYDLKGKYWQIKMDEWVWPEVGLGSMRRPFQKPHPPIALSAMSPFSKTVSLAAARRWHAVTANFIPHNHVASHWQMYRKGAQEAGIEPDPDRWSVARHILVAETDAEAKAYLSRRDHALVHYYQYLIGLMKRANFAAIMKPDGDMPDDQLTVPWALENLIIAGSPHTVAEKILAFRQQVGPFGTIVMVAHDWDDPAFHKRSMELMAHEVMPMLNKATAT